MGGLRGIVPKVVTAAGALTLAVGCSTGSTGSLASSPSSATTPAGAGSGEPLIVYSAQGYDSAVTNAFSKATGIAVKLVDDSTGPLLTKIAAEGDNPQWGLLWVDGDTAFAALDKQGKLLAYTPAASFNAAGHTLTPANHSYVPTGATVVPALIYNAAHGAKVPATYQDLLGPDYAGKVGMNDPAQSGPTFPLIAGLMNQLGGQSNGVSAGEDYLKKLKANGLHVYPTNGDTLHALETGQITYGLIQSSAAEGEAATAPKSADFEPKVIYIAQSTLLPSAIGIDKAASPAAQDAAKKFVDFVLSPAGQKAMQDADPTGDSLYWPVVDGVGPIAGMPAFPNASQRIDPYFWGPQEDQINTFFDSNIK